MKSSQLKPTSFFSWTLFKRDLRSNFVLIVAITIVMVLMCVILTTAANTMSSDQEQAAPQETQEELFTYLAALATFNQAAGAELSCEDFAETNDTTLYEQAFNQINALSNDEKNLTVEEFQSVLNEIDGFDVPLEKYIDEFEYAYALAEQQGAFSNKNLTVEDMVDTVLEVSGVSTDLVNTMGEIDTSSLIDTMYLKGTGILSILLLVVLLANSLVASPVDKGSMAYVLATPIKRRAVAFTHMLFMIVVPAVVLAVVCLARIAVESSFASDASVQEIIVMYIGMYLLTEATAGISYFGSCLFNTSGRSLAFGGGIAVWFFLASFLGIFGSPELVDIGMGVQDLDIFNSLTLTGFYNIDAISTLGSSVIDWSFLSGFAAMGVIALVCYVAGALAFNHKNLPI